MRGPLPALSDVAPRTCRSAPALGLADAVLDTLRPATLPVSISMGLFIAPFWKSALLTCTMELESSFRLSEP